MRVVFMGTPDFAVPCLNALLKSTVTVVGVVSQPDRPKGRGRRIIATPVAAAARNAGCPLFQWPRLNQESYETLGSLDADLFVVVAYGKILPARYLVLPTHGCWNVHASVLPQLRGAAPIQWALINGMSTTGVSLMKLDEGMDTGPVAHVNKLDILPTETAATLHDRLSLLGAQTLEEGLELMQTNALTFTAQNHEDATHARPLSKTDGRVDWTQSAQTIYQRYQGMTPWPGCTVDGRSEQLKLISLEPIEGHGIPGEVLNLDKRGVRVATGSGALLIKSIQRPNRKPVSGIEYARALNLEIGQQL